jgi:hypothetical protein
VGSLGDGTRGDRSVPFPQPVLASRAPFIPFLSVMAIGSGPSEMYGASCAVRTDRSVWCWGANFPGDNTAGDPVRVYPVRARRGVLRPGLTPPPLNRARSVRNGCALLTSGTLWCWGPQHLPTPGINHYRRLTARLVLERKRVPMRHIRQYDGAGGKNCVTRTNGTLWCWGVGGRMFGDGSIAFNSLNVHTTPVSAHDVVRGRRAPILGVSEVAVGGTYTCHLKRDGTVWCWGRAIGTDPPAEYPVQVTLPDTTPVETG